MARTFVMGDIHGAYRALRQCLDRTAFDYGKDHLICLGDVCDGWPETKSCVDELLKITNLTYILGNHDQWLLDWMKTGFAPDVWVKQGGLATIQSYVSTENVPPGHVRFLQAALPYFVQNNKLFVHAGIDTKAPLEQQGPETFLWDRSLSQKVLTSYLTGSGGKLTSFDEIYIGHTPIPYLAPIHGYEVWMMDTGAGWSGVLSMMNIDTKEIIVSDLVPGLYPGVKGRHK